MITRNLSVEDAEKIHDAFRSVSINRNQERMPDYGFFEYPLSLDDFKARLYDSRLSIALEDGKRREPLAYVLAYPFWQIPDLDTKNDLVLPRLKGHPELVYVDQFFMKPGLPAFIAGRLVDIWTTLAQGYTRQGTVCAIPQNPWKNIPSTRFAIDRGFSRQGVVKGKNIEFAIFGKPFWELGDKTSNLSLSIK